MHNWHCYPDAESAAQAAADFIADEIRHLLQHQDVCRLALPGGSTPAKCFQYLAQHDINWSQVHWYLGDERCLPVGDRERNDVMIQQHLWSVIQAPLRTIHRIPAELGACAAASAYADEMNHVELDIALLGMGEDGHTASLFPGNIALDDGASAVPVFNAPKPPAERVSLGLGKLQQARRKIVLATGAGKQQAIIHIHHGDALPVNRIGDIDWFVDEAAMTAWNKINKHFS